MHTSDVETEGVDGESPAPGRFVPRRDSDENLALSRDSAMSIRICPVGCQFKNSPAVWMETMAAGRAPPPVSSRRNEERAFQTHRASLGEAFADVGMPAAGSWGARRRDAGGGRGGSPAPGRIPPTGRRVWRSRTGRTLAVCNIKSSNPVAWSIYSSLRIALPRISGGNRLDFPVSYSSSVCLSANVLIIR